MKLCTYMEYYPKFNFHSHSAHFLHDFLLTSALLAPTTAISTDFVNMNMKLGKWTPGIPKCPYIYQKYIFCQCRKNQKIWPIFSRNMAVLAMTSFCDNCQNRNILKIFKQASVIYGWKDKSKQKSMSIWIIFSRKFQASAPVKNDDVIAKNSHISAKNSPNLIIFQH